MATIEMGDTKVDLDDGSSITNECSDLGIPFSCRAGVCGSCLINVTEGEDNLSDLTDAEKSYGLLDKKKRLACQCRITSGNVKIESGY